MNDEGGVLFAEAVRHCHDGGDMIAAARTRRGTRRDAAMKAAARKPDSVWSGRPTAHEIERRKQQVIVVAADMFLTLGFAETTIRGIARVSRVSVRTINHHYGDKETVFREAILARVSEASAVPVYDEEANLVSALQSTALECHQMALNSRSIELMRLLIAESARFPDLMSQIGVAIYLRFQSDIAARFRNLARRGLIPEGDHDQSAQLFTDLLLGNQATMFYAGWTDRPPVAKNIGVKVDLFIRGRFGVRYLEVLAPNGDG